MWVGFQHLDLVLVWIRALWLLDFVSLEQQLDPELHDKVLAQALAEVSNRSITGKEVTPFLLAYFQEHTHGQSLEVNIDIARNNIMLGAEIAAAWAKRGA